MDRGCRPMRGLQEGGSDGRGVFDFGLHVLDGDVINWPSFG